MPGLAPPFWVWTLIGVAYYVLFFFLISSLLSTQPTIPLTEIGVALTAILMVLNAGWNWVFFRRKSLRLSFLLFMPYLACALLLALVLHRLGNPFFVWYLLYLFYLLWATWWGCRVWRLNPN